MAYIPARCEPFSTLNVRPGWICCSCGHFNADAVRTCSCGHERCTTGTAKLLKRSRYRHAFDGLPGSKP